MILSFSDDKLSRKNHWGARNVYFLWFYLYPFCGDSLQTGARNSWKILQRFGSCQKSSRKRNNIPIASTSSLMKKELTNQNWVSWLFLLPPSGKYFLALSICTWFLKNQVRWTGFLTCKNQFQNWFLQATQAVWNPVWNRLKIQFDWTGFFQLDFSKIKYRWIGR